MLEIMAIHFLYEKEIDHFTKSEVQRSNWVLVLCDQGHADVRRDPMFSVPGSLELKSDPLGLLGLHRIIRQLPVTDGAEVFLSLSNRGRWEGKREKDILPKL